MSFVPQAQPAPAPYRPEIAITQLGADISDSVQPARFPTHKLRYRNDAWAAAVGLGELDKAAWLHHFGALAPLPGNLDPPLALRYHGHQFRNYNPDIGDGRGFLFAQLRDGSGRLLDLGTKGSGTTPFSRSGDGRLTLKGAVREILATEMLSALGLYTSKTFSVVETGEELWREDEPSPTRGAVLVRLSHSHIRIGSFQRAAYEDNRALLERLVNYCLTNLYDAQPGDDPAAQLFALVMQRCAQLAGGYMACGFVHGVLNSDNINITGESFDYGPWRFAPSWNPGFTAAYFDHAGLYCLARQPEAIHWNLGQLGACLRSLTSSEALIATLERFPRAYGEAFVAHSCWRLGVVQQGFEQDKPLIMAMEKALAASQCDLPRFFDDWRRELRPSGYDHPDFTEFAERIAAHPRTDDVGSALWADDAPVDCAIATVETLWSAIAEQDNWSPLYDHIDHIRRFGQNLRSAQKIVNLISTVSD